MSDVTSNASSHHIQGLMSLYKYDKISNHDEKSYDYGYNSDT